MPDSPKTSDIFPTTSPRSTQPGGPGIVVVGDLVTDVVVVLDGGNLATGSDTAASITLTGGGQGANTAAWLARSGRPVTLVAAVGDDPAGRERVAELTSLGVRCAVRILPDTATGSVVVLASPGERTMITDRGASLSLDPAHVTAAIIEAPGAAHVHLSGYPLLDPASRPAGLAALAAARTRGSTTSVDAASAVPLRRAGAFLDWVRVADLLLCNADEAGALAGAGSTEDRGIALSSIVRNVVVKRGAAGAIWCAGGTLVATAAGPPVPVVDPTGAGDAFAAGLLAAWCDGADPADALVAGASLGAEAVGRIGARPA